MNATGEPSNFGTGYLADTNPITKTGQPTRTTSTTTTLPPPILPQRRILRSTPQTQTHAYSRRTPTATYSAESTKQTGMSYTAFLLVFVLTIIVYYLLSTEKVNELLQKIVPEPYGVIGTLIKGTALAVVIVITNKIGGA